MKYEVPKRLAGITFGILSPEEIKKIAVVQITQPELYNERGEGFPAGPLDPKLGAPDNINRCATCGLRRREGETGCLGHFGYIELAKPIYHLGFVKHIEKVLNAICEKCGRLTLPPEKRNYYWKKLEKFIKRYGYANIDIAKEVLNEAAKVKKCPYCGYEKLGKFVWDKDQLTFFRVLEVSEEEAKSREEIKELLVAAGLQARKVKVAKGKKGKRIIRIPLNPEIVRQILANIYPEEVSVDEDEGAKFSLLPEEERKEREKDVYLIGFHPKYAKPEWTILKYLPVPPITVRPPVITAEGKRTEDQLTLLLRDIVRINEQLRSKSKGGPPQVIESLWNQLQKRVMYFFGLHKLGAVRLEKTIVKGIVHRLSGKEGRFRHNLSGKRVDYSGRAVISPDPYLSVDEIGVPERMAKKLLFPEVVNELNSERLKQLVINGPFKYPGAEYIWKKEAPGYYGRKIMLGVLKDKAKREEEASNLKPGDIVERHLLDGDILVFNRQPTLHRISMMGHYVRVLPYNTLRLHLMACPPYNADFDGDEMNVHLPRSYETKAEIMLLMEVKRHIITPRYGGPIIGPKQDFITGAYLLTKKGSLLSKEEAEQVLFYAGIEELPKDSITLDGEIFFDGKKVFSMIIPKYIFFEKKIKGILVGEPDKEGAKTVVRNGELIEGVIEKGAIGAEKSENIIHKVVERWGHKAGRRFLNGLSALVLRYLTDRGFSLTLWDVIVAQTARDEILKVINKYVKEANELVRKYEAGELEPEPGKSVEDTFEDRLIDILDEARNKAGELVARRMPPESQFGTMTLTGARGDETNIAQVLACIGQPVVRGKRIRRGYEKRILPHFKKGDKGVFAGGFVIRNFAIGMSPIEYFFHSAAGRDSLVDTAVRTADSGYFYRRLVNALQDSRIEYDGTARMMSGQIIQFKYGGDGVHPGKSYHGKVADFESIFYELIVRREEAGLPAPKVSGWPKYYDKVIETLEKEVSRAAAMDVEELFERELKRGRVLTEEEAEEFIRIVKEKYMRAQIDPGEAAGTVAAQSICEPATQLTLRTFHWAGVAAFSITTGLPRLKEIFDAVEKPSTPMITVKLRKDIERNEEAVKRFFTKIKGITITDIAKSGVGISVQPIQLRVKIELDPQRVVLDEEALKKRKHAELLVTRQDVINALKSIGKDVTVVVDSENPYVLYVSSSQISLSDLYKKIRNLVIKGFKEYTRAQIKKEEGGRYSIVISSTELKPLLYMEEVDLSRLETNNIHQFATIFGIEAARRLIVKEAKDVLDSYGLDVDVRHLLYAVDVMTMQGKIEAIGRYGIAGKKTSLLARAAFEETGKHIFRAAAVGMHDPLPGATENVIVGGIPPVGTGIIRLGFLKRWEAKREES